MSIPNTLSIEKIGSHFKVLLDKNRHQLNVPEEVVDEIFNKACEEKPLFNGTLVCVKRFTPQAILGYTVSYKEFLASHFLGQSNLHHPLAVSGCIFYREQVLFGIRSEKVMFAPLQLELVPSGGVDESAIENGVINFQHALINEFEEETGLVIDNIKSIQPEFIVYCKEKQIYDIFQSIILKDDETLFCDEYNDEYNELFWVPLTQLKNFVEENRSKMHPVSLAIITSKLLS